MSEFIYVLNNENNAENFKNEAGEPSIPADLPIKIVVEADSEALAHQVMLSCINTEMWKLA
jgi:hypothetical protein